jgi:hypothetical protein
MRKMSIRKGLASLTTALLVVSGIFTFMAPAIAAAPNWNTTGSYVVALNYLGTDYPHDMSLTQDGLGNLTGNGGSPAGANVYTWVIDSGSVSGDTINFSAHYTATADAVTPLTVMNVTGVIAPGGTMSGTWSDNYNGGSRAGTWTTTSGNAVLIPPPTPGPVCTVPGDYATIQLAVNNVNCTTINVAAGVYAEHVAVNHSVILNGANVGVAGNGTRVAESIVDGTDTGAPFAITANGVTINGFTVKNGSNGGLDAGIWSQTGTQNSSILNNIITQNDFGIWAQCGGTCLIQANLFDGNNKPGSGSGSASISADSTTGLTINNNEFKNDTAGNPILLQAVSAGKHINVVVSDNSFHNSANSNIYVLGVTGGTFSGNTITPASDATGISFSGADANITVTKNIITGGARGIRVEDAGYYGPSGGNSNITVNKNSLASDSTYGLGNTDAAISNLDGTCNWWGAASGPGPVGPGSGSPVTANVNFATWLTSSDLNGACNGPVSTFTLTYTAGANGSITGTSPQTVNQGASGSAVTAVANSGFHFVNWSDSSTANPRTDTNVQANISVSANFSSNPSSGGGGGGGRIVPPTTGQVLGASIGPIPGCGFRTTGFSTATGESCATNAPHSDGQVLGASSYLFTLFLHIGPPYLNRTEVAELQKFLTAAGFDSRPIDGLFGPITRAAVIRFQIANGLVGDGFVGPLTRAVLNK